MKAVYSGNDIKLRLLAAVKHKGIDARTKSLAAATGCRERSIIALFTQDFDEPSFIYGALRKVCDILGVSVNWVLTGKGAENWDYELMQIYWRLVREDVARAKARK